jgi:hypothetical protein
MAKVTTTDDGLLDAFSVKCPEHGYLVAMVKDTRDTMKAEVVEARAWRERTTGDIFGIKEAIALHVASEQGIASGKAEVTAEIQGQVRSWVRVAKWVLGVLAALTAGGGVAEGIRRMFGGG